MSFLQPIVFALAIVLTSMGLFVLVSAWAFPRLLETPSMRWLVTGKRLQPTQANQVLMGAWSLLIGSYFLLSVGGFRTLSYIAFAAWLPIAFLVLRRSFRRAAA